MKKFVTFTLTACMAFSFVACNNSGNTPPASSSSESSSSENNTPVITLQEVYEAGKDYAALLGDHDNLYIVTTSNGKVLYETYLGEDYFYSFYDAEYMDIGMDNASFITSRSEYSCFDNVYERCVSLAPNGIINLEDPLALAGQITFVASVILDDDYVITEQDGLIIVTCTSDATDLYVDEGVISCAETYTLDATTREMLSVKTVYTFEDGTTKEGIATITRDVETPEGAKPFLAYDQATENLRTITIVSNPGTENEKNESIQAPKGMNVGLYPDYSTEKTFTLYADAACTQVVEEGLDVNSDATVYVKWDE